MVLPDTVFFEPTEDFLNFFVPLLKGRKVIDAGAGVGMLTKTLRERGVNIHGIDLHMRVSINPYVSYADATTFNYPDNGVVIFARPCRGYWIQESVKRALSYGCVVYYIPRIPRFKDDYLWHDFAGNLKIIWRNAGAGQEIVCRIGEEKQKTMATFCLIQPHKSIPMYSWFKKVGNRLENDLGGGFTWDGEPPVETVEAEDFVDLDWTKTSLSQPNSDSGWLSREGVFYGCRSQDHDNVAYYIIHKEVGALEKEGWVRVYYSQETATRIGQDTGWIICDKRLSPHQRNWLQKRGHKVEDED